MTTPYWSDFVPDSTFYQILSGFHITFATGVACRQGTLTPPDTWSRLFGTCICSTCWDQSFSRTCRYFYGLCSSNIPRYFLDFALYNKPLQTLKIRFLKSRIWIWCNTPWYFLDFACSSFGFCRFGLCKFLPTFTTVYWERWSTSNFHLRQTRWFKFPHHKLSVPM